MRKRYLAVVVVTLASTRCWAGSGEIRKLFQDALAPGTAVPGQAEFFNVVNEDTVLPLSEAEVSDLLPLAKQAIQSTKSEIRQFGMMFIISVSLRTDSSKLLEPYVDDLVALANGSGGAQSLRHGALYILGTTRPSIIPKAVPYLLSNLDNQSNSLQETITIAACLLDAFQSNQAIVDKVLTFVKSRSQTVLTTSALHLVGLSKITSPPALSFVGISLDSTDANVRFAAVEAASRYNHDIRQQFASQLGRIAADPEESIQLRSMATAALSH